MPVGGELRTIMRVSASNPTSPRRSWSSPLWLRIGGAVLVGYLIATLATAAILASLLNRVAQESHRTRIDEALELLTPAAERAIREADYTQFARATKAASGMEGLRITLILPDGEVVAESERPLPLPNHSDRPEIAQALATGRGESVRNSTTVGEPFLYVGTRLTSTAGEPIGVLRLSVPERISDRHSADLLTLLLLALGGGLPIVALVAWYAARRIARPLEQMTAAATRMAGGDFGSLPRGGHADEAGRLAEALNQMGSKLETMLDVSEADRAELAAILGSMVEGVIALDVEEQVIRANGGAAQLLGTEDIPAPGTPLLEVVRLPDLAALARQGLSGAHVRDRDISLPGPEGTILNVSAAPIRSAPGAVTGAVLVIRDVSSLRRLERTRLDFVANVSHELRTPVATVMGALETVQDLGENEDPVAERQLVATAFRNAKRLSSIVNDLLALSAIETEASRMERYPVPLERSIRSSAGALAGESATGGVTVRVPGPDTEEITVLGHEGRLELVWINLIGNAIKYSNDGGSVTVGVTCDHEHGLACVTITDAGAGIPPEALPRIFERFYRVDKGRSRDRGGTGLGLAIVKHIVRAHRGRIDVESALDVGTTFRVWLPLYVAAATE